MSPHPQGETELSPRRRRRRPSALGVVGLVLVVAGLSCLGWLAYSYLGTNLVADRRFVSESSQLREHWRTTAVASAAAPTSSASGSPTPTAAPASAAPASPAPASPAPGQPTALLRIPRFGAGYEVPVVEGTSPEALSRGVGHYPGTAAPGTVGNFALAGHRVSHGQPFRRLLELRVGDQVVVETSSAVYTYVLDTAPRDLTVADTAGWVLDPVPGDPEARPTRPLITLTTGQDLLPSRDRSVAFGHLVSTQNK